MPIQIPKWEIAPSGVRRPSLLDEIRDNEADYAKIQAGRRRVEPDIDSLARSYARSQTFPTGKRSA